MQAEPTTHPHLEQLSDFAMGRLESAELDAVESHLATCPACCDTLNQIKEDTFVGLVRQAKDGGQGAGGSAPADTDLDRPATANVGMLVQSLQKRKEVINDMAAALAEVGTQAHSQPASAAMGTTEPAAAIHMADIPHALANHTRYRIEELIGAGGMGAVYKAQHRLMQRAVALKVINPKFMQSKQAVERFRREAKAAARLDHPNIVRAHDAEQAGDVHFLVMEYVKGTDLQKVLDQRGPLPVVDACEYIRQAALGLQHAHENGMVHRDIKPQNLMVVSGRVVNGEKAVAATRHSPLTTHQVKILDFGLASLTEAVMDESAESSTIDGQKSGLTQAGALMGTPDYMAPEQAKDARTADIRSDIYSLGCTLYTLLAGKVPFPGGTAIDKVIAHSTTQPQPITEVRGDVPAALVKVLDKMMAKEPAQRYQTPADVAAAVASLSSLGSGAGSAGRTRRRLAVALLSAAAVIFLGGVIWITTDSGRLKIEGNVDDLQLTVSKDGKEYEVIDVKSGTAVKRLASGDYQIKPKGNRTDVRIDPQGFTIERWGEKVVKVSIVPPEAKEAKIAALPDEFKKEFDLVLRAGRRQLAEQAKDNLLAENHPLMSQLIHPPTKKLIEFFAKLPDAAHRELLFEGYLKWKLADLDAERQSVFRDNYKLQLDMAKKEGGAIPATMSMEAFEKADVGVALVHIPQFKATVASTYLLLPDHPHPIWVTMVGAKAAGKKPYFEAHQEQLPALRSKPYSKSIVEFATGADTHVGEIRRFEALDKWVPRVAFSPDGRLISNGDTNGSGRGAWDVSTGKLALRFNLTTRGGWGLAVSPDGARALSSDSTVVHLMDLATGRELHSLQGHTAGVWDAVFLADGKRAVTGGEDRTLRIWDLETGQELKRFENVKEAVRCLALSPNGRHLAAGHYITRDAGMGVLRLWDVETGKEVRASIRMPDVIHAVVFARDGKHVLTGDRGGVLRLWNLDSGAEVRRFDGHTGPIESIALIPDGRVLSAGGWKDGTLRIWDGNTGKQLHSFSGPEVGLLGLAVATDGLLAATGAKDGVVRLWRLPSN